MYNKTIKHFNNFYLGKSIFSTFGQLYSHFKKVNTINLKINVKY